MNSFWEEFCKYCDQSCCKKGAVLILPEEKEKIVEAAGKEEYFEDHGTYFILGGEPCTYLEKDGKCSIHDIKSKDCKEYPIFIKPLNGSYEWRVDIECPASDNLPEEFIEDTKKSLLSLTSILRKIDWDISSKAGFKTKKLE